MKSRFSVVVKMLRLSRRYLAGVLWPVRVRQVQAAQGLALRFHQH